MKKILSLFAGAALFAASSLSASAHAFLDHATPAVGSVTAQVPTAVKIWFTEEVEPAFSVIEVRDASGKQVDRKDTRTDAKDAAILAVSLPPLPTGTYRVSWHVVAKDTHKTQGSFSFTVGK